MYVNGNGQGDFLGSAVGQMLIYLGAREYGFAGNQFSFICDVLNDRGNPGKQVRYVARELNEFASDASPKVARAASKYAAHLQALKGSEPELHGIDAVVAAQASENARKRGSFRAESGRRL